MADVQKLEKAKRVYADFCRMLDDEKIKYDRDDEKLKVVIRSGGDDLPMTFIVVVKAEQQVISLYSPMTFNVEEEKRFDCALAITSVNYSLISGYFDMDMSDGEIRFRMTNAYHNTELSQELLKHMLFLSVAMVERYNDKLFMLTKNMLTLEKFIEWDQSPS